MMKTVKLLPCALLAGVSLFVACSSHSGWSLKGNVEGAEPGTRLAVEACNAGNWYVLDSVAVGKNGSFDYHAAEPAQWAEIMRVTLPGKGSVYFPVQGSDCLTLSASADGFATGARMSGTAMAGAVAAVDSIVASTDNLDDLRRSLSGIIISDTTGIIAYYTIGKSVGNQLIFDPQESFGNRIYGAAAQVYDHYKPEDPHGQVLKAAFFAGRQSLGKSVPQQQTIELPAQGFIDIVRYDAKGAEHKISDLVQPGKVVLVSFTGYDQDFSPAYNKILNDLYSLYHSKGLEIYQIAFDESEVEWKEASRNLPWTAVWNSSQDGTEALIAYNVGALPMTFVIGKTGEIEQRVVDPSQLPAAVGKLF